MQIADVDNIAKRMRYYQGLIDGDKLKHGWHICIFRERCNQNYDLSLNDETVKILLNTKDTLNDVSEEIKNFLNYVDSGIVSGKFVKELYVAIQVVKSNEKSRLEIYDLSNGTP